jgi:regulator of cell morphogenesis and NO signaling
MTTGIETNQASAAKRDWESAPLSELTEYIVETHHVFLRAHLPQIQARLERMLGKKPEDICGFVPDLAKTFFALKEELDAHLMKEERILFPMIVRMEQARAAGDALPANHCGTVQAPIRQMEHEHSNGKKALETMRQLTGGYPIVDDMCKNRRGLFEDLLSLETDLFEHMHLENDILHPRAAQLEQAP